MSQCEILLDLARSQLRIVGEEGDINTQTASCFSLLGFSVTAVPAEHTPRHNRPDQTRFTEPSGLREAFIKDYHTSLLHSSYSERDRRTGTKTKRDLKVMF